jgi:hypothetical protein
MKYMDSRMNDLVFDTSFCFGDQIVPIPSFSCQSRCAMLAAWLLPHLRVPRPGIPDYEDA